MIIVAAQRWLLGNVLVEVLFLRPSLQYPDGSTWEVGVASYDPATETIPAAVERERTLICAGAPYSILHGLLGEMMLWGAEGGGCAELKDFLARVDGLRLTLQQVLQQHVPRGT